LSSSFHLQIIGRLWPINVKRGIEKLVEHLNKNNSEIPQSGALLIKEKIGKQTIFNPQ